MTTLYRSPNVIIDSHEWYLAVRRKDGRVGMQYYWRPLSLKSHMWQSIASWQGPKPFDMWRFFRSYRPHALQAVQAEKARPGRAACGGVVTRAVYENPGMEAA